jgi:hypothetical protein
MLLALPPHVISLESPAAFDVKFYHISVIETLTLFLLVFHT